MLVQIYVFVDFLLHYADPKFVNEVNLKKIRLAPTHYFGKGGTEQIMDLIFQCPLKNGKGNLTAVIVFEHQSGSLKKIPRKLHKYISAIWDAETKEKKKVLSAPYFIVLRTGKKPIRGTPPKMSDSLPKGSDGKPLGKTVEIEYDIVDLPAWNFDNLVGGAVLRLTLGLLHKMAGGNIDELPEALKPLLEVTDTEERIELAKEAAIPFAMKVFATHNRRLDEVQVDEVLKPIFKEKERAMIKTILEEKFDEGIAIGEAKSEVKWKVDTLLKIIRGKFGKIPKETEKAISQMTDPIALDSWAVHAATCQSMKEFAEALK